MNDSPTPPSTARADRKSGPAAAPVPTRDAWLARIAEVGPLAKAGAPEADRARMLSAELMDALHARELFRLLLPGAFGGYEFNLPDYFQAMETLASYDASTAWCVCQGNCCAMIAGYLDAPVAERIWAGNPTAVLAWGPGMAEAKAVEGGYRLTATSAFASGSHHASWLGAHGSMVRDADGSIRLGADGKPENRTLMFPADATTLIENWDVLGLRGTGSDAFEIDDLFVPDEMTIVRATMIDNRPPHGGAPIYGFPQMSVHATGFAATATGAARGFIDAFVEMAQSKTPRLHTSPLRDKPVVQSDLARAEARLSAGRAWLLAEVEGAWRDAEANGALSIERRNRIRLAATNAIHEAKAAVDLLYDHAGTSAVFADGPFERRFRDIHMVAQQIQGRKSHYQTVGAWMLGHEPDVTVI